VQGVVTADQLAHAIASRDAGEPAGALVTAPMVHAHPDHPSDIVLQRLAQAGGLLPVLSREQAHVPVGVVTLHGIVRFLDGDRGKRPNDAAGNDMV
jgi:CBS domain-containing protein